MKAIITVSLIGLAAWYFSGNEVGPFMLFFVVFYTAIMISEGIKSLQDRIDDLEYRLTEKDTHYEE